MSTLTLPWTLGHAPTGSRTTRMDYKKKLQNKAASLNHARRTEAEAQDAEESSYVAAIRALAAEEQAGRVIFQSMAVTALQMIEQVYGRMCQALDAALSLGQQQKLEGMEDELQAVVEALRGTLSKQGAQMLDLCDERRQAAAAEASWWFALTETIEALEEGAQQMESLVEGQPEGPARRLSQLVAEMLRQQHARLLVEADQWIS